MNKKLWLLVVSLIMTILVSACTVGNTSIVFDTDCPTGYALEGAISGQRCVTDAELQLGREEAQKFMGIGAKDLEMTPEAGSTGATALQPAATSAPAATAAPAALNFGECTEPDFSSFVGNPYGLIAKLDAQSGKVPQPNVPFTIDATEGCLLYWTGAYTGGKLPTGFRPLLVDGQTGVFIVEENTLVTINTVGAYMALSSFDSNAQPRTEDDMPEAHACMPTGEMVKLLNDYGRADPERFFRSLDEATNVEGAPFLSARYRPEPLEAKTYQGLDSGTAVFWVQEGQVGGVEGQDYVLLVASNGKWAVLNLKDTLELKYAHTGVQLCEGLDLTAKVTWWGN